jgi:EmrB/QacA subfamily drug resistance transporter
VTVAVDTPASLAAPAQTSRHSWTVFSVTAIGVLLSGLNASTLDVALPAVVRHFDTSATAATWILLSYLLVSTVLILPFGRLADIVGRRMLFLAGIALLTGASLLAGAAPNVQVLILARVLQAVAGALLQVNVTALLTDAFPVSKLSLALGMNVTVAGVGLVAGPALGGLLADSLSWRAVFWFNVPFGVIGLLWGAATLRELPHDRVRESFDVVGAFLATAVVGSVTAVIALGGTQGWTTPAALALMGVFAVGLPALIVTQLRRTHPLIDLDLFRNKERAIAYAVTFILAMARFGIVLLMALYLQAAHGWTAARTGLAIMPCAIGMMAAAPVAARLARHYSARVLSTTGLVLTAVGLGYLGLALSPTMGTTEIVIALVVIGVGSGACMTPNTSSIMASVAPDRRGIANAMRATLANTGTVAGTAVCLAIVTAPLLPRDKSAAYAGTLSELSADTLPLFTDGYHAALLMLAVVSAIGAVASLMRNPPPTA